MPLSWNENNKRAIEFSTEWKDTDCERAKAKSFWDSFFLDYLNKIRNTRNRC